MVQLKTEMATKKDPSIHPLSIHCLILIRVTRQLEPIQFQGKEGSFQVCLRAIIPCHVLEVPDSVMLPLCAVQHSSHTNFLLKNASKLQTSFQFECDTPFQLNPKQGMLKPGQECHITVVFQPQEALVYQQHAYCWFGEEGDKAENCCTVLLQALGTVRTIETGEHIHSQMHTLSGVVFLFYMSLFASLLQVTVSFSLSSLSGGIPLLGSVFSCDVTRGNVAPGGSLRATVTYSPAIVNTVSVEYLILKCRGALNEPLLKLTGNCIGPKVSLSSSVVDFGCVEEGGSVVQTVKLVNSSPVEAVYKWDIDCNGNSVFSILPASGTLFPQSYTTLKAVYRPTQPITHHRRVACVILHRDPVFLDLTGTSHPKLQKPVILTPEHLVDLARRQLSPDTLNAVQHNHDVHLDQQGGTIPSHSTIQLQSIVRPHRRAQYLWNISYQTVNASGK
uniref:Si:ch1073-349o24.2 n=1 Tax=Amphiprion percula TaxID=161767 RepID=A0A3P8SQI1_AMPPE